MTITTAAIMRRTVKRRYNETVLSQCLLLILSTYFLSQTTRVRSIRIDPLSAAARHKQRDLRSQPAIPNVAVQVPTDPNDHFVASLPLWQSNDGQSSSSFSMTSWAGHLPASADGDKYFFYWLFAPEASDSKGVNEEDIPLLIWLNGGPGCSSMDGLFLENGPLRFVTNDVGDIYMTDNPYSWNKAPAYTLYIDQPVGTGLSFTTSRKYPTNDEEVNIDFYYFLKQFFLLHSDKTANRPVYFSGESHAGHYIPSMIHYILQQNAKPDTELVVNIRGAAIGNGWMDPFHQYAAAEAAYAHGMLDRPQVNALDESERQCQASLTQGNYANSVCFSLLDKVVAQSHGSNSQYKVSTYDARLAEQKGSSRDFPPGHKLLETYLGNWPVPSGQAGKLQDWDAASTNQQVLQAIHATAATAAGQRFSECTDPPYDALAHQDGKGVVPDVVAILEHSDNVRLLFFNGMEDLICNHVGNEEFLINMQWSGQHDWIKAPRYAWRAESEEQSKVSGYMKENKNLLFLKLLNSGHMVPLDIPRQSLEMMYNFMYDKSFDQSPQSINPQAKQDSCPICPRATCDDAKNNGHSIPATATTTSAVIQSAYIPWAVAAIAVLSLIAVALTRRKQPRIHQELISDYDLELREGSYSDQQEFKVAREIS
ncbi:hypothetical protein MPSEU_000163200 [Mayamaea pseudoterrestris]|nr:hypothetical protein MPSEU_000163200 [Mayamaea pseudoterrestris]